MFYLAIGSYTKHKTIDARGAGVSIVRRGDDHNSFAIVSEDASVQNPTYLDWDPNTRRLYSVSETSGGKGAVAAFSVGKDGRLGFLDQREGSGRSACHLVALPNLESLFAASYSGGQLTGFALEKGNIGGVFYHCDYSGSGPNSERQNAPHAHQVTMSPFGPFLYVCDLGTDTIRMHKLDSGSTRVGEPDTALAVPPGYGPRHLTYDPLSPTAYILCELVPKLLVAAIDTTSGRMNAVQELDTVEPEKAGIAAPAAVKLHPSGRTLAVSNRFDDTIAVFAIARRTGTDGQAVAGDAAVPSLSLVQRFPCAGKTPRDICFSPDGGTLFIANQDSHTVTTRYFDTITGLPGPDWGPSIKTGAPVCVVIID